MKTKRFNKRKKKKSGYRTISVLGEGKCEYYYFQGLKECEKEILNKVKVTFKPDKPSDNGRKCNEIFKEAWSLIDEYDVDYVFCVLDNDIIGDCVKNTVNYQKELNKLCKLCEKRKSINVDVLDFSGNLTVQQIIKSRKAIVILKNMPCLEFWYLLHFEYTARLEKKCCDVKNRLEIKYINDYSKKDKRNHNNKIYTQLREKLPVAVKNAEEIDQLRVNNPENSYSYSELHYLMHFLEII